MVSSTLRISGKVLGKSQNLFTSWQMDVPAQSLTLEELLTQIVRSEIQAFQARQADRWITKVLELVDIEAGVVAGKISSGGSELEQVVDELGAILQGRGYAIENALQAFKDGFPQVEHLFKTGGLCNPSGQQFQIQNILPISRQ